MGTLNIEEIEKRIAAVEASWQRQLALSGGRGYDPKLTESLKKDLDWLEEEKRTLIEFQNRGISRQKNKI
jgi:hypothetical protein